MDSGHLTLALLTLMAFVAALAIAVRSRPSGRAELALSTGVVWNVLIALPIYVLGNLSALTRGALGVLSTVTFVIALGVTFVKVDPRAHAIALARAAWAVLTLPFAGIAEARRARSLVFPVLGLAFCVIAYSFPMAWYTPAWRGWDALWYHEPIVGFTIQMHGFAPLDIPAALQKVNGYPRLGEMTQLWFVIFTDRRLIDVAHSFVAPILVVAEYLLCMRYCRDKVASMGWGAALLLMPAGMTLIQSTYVDLHVAALELAAAYYATRPEMRLRDGWLTAGALALAVGAKQMALVPVGILSVIALVRLLRQNVRGRKLVTFSTLLGGVALIFAMFATTYVRNWIHFKNPFWPELKVDSDALGIHWPGNYEWTNTDETSADYNHIDMNLPFGQFLDDLWSTPYSWKRSHYGEVHDYGYPIAWFVLPFGLLLVFVHWMVVWRAVVGRIFRTTRWRVADDTKNILLLNLTAVAMLYTTPALWASRYNIAATGMLMALIAWLGGRANWDRLREGTSSFVAFGMAIGFFWVTPRWWLTPTELWTLSKIPYPAREVTPAALIGPYVDMHNGSPVMQDVGIKREKTLGRGAVLAYSDSFSNFSAYFWNNDFSNRIVYVPSGPTWVERAKQTNAMWVYCGYGDPVFKELAEPGSGWTNLGTLNVEHWGVIFRRDRW